MATSGRFLVVEFSAAGLAFGDWTRNHEGTTVDIISEPVKDVGGERLHPSLFLVKGASRPALLQIMELLDRVHGPVESVRLDVLRGQWLGRMTVKESQLQSSAAMAIAQFQHRFGSPWTHIEDGIVYLRAKLNANEDGERLQRQLVGFLAQEDIPAQVSVEEFSTHDYGVWDDLVQASIGLTN
jgi:hypothetical protein